MASVSLFREKPVAEVQDSVNQLSQDVVRLRGEFGRALKGNYQAVIDTNELVHSLYGDIELLDSQLLQMCFGDDDLLPRIQDVEFSTVNKRRRSAGQAHNGADIGQFDSRNHDFDTRTVQEVLMVSSWLSALSTFKKNPAVPDKLSSVISYFSRIPVNNTVLKHCANFGDWLLSERPVLSLDQYLCLLKLTEQTQFQFNAEVNEWLFAQIISHRDILLGNLSNQMSEFTKTPRFREAMTERLISECEAEFAKWDQHKDETDLTVHKLQPYDTTLKTSVLIQEVTLYEKGLIDSRRTLLHECNTKVGKLLQSLKTYADAQKYQAVHNKLIEILDAEKCKGSATIDIQSDTATMDDLVDSVLLKRNNAHYVSYLIK